jgi:hypothetical protein
LAAAVERIREADARLSEATARAEQAAKNEKETDDPGEKQDPSAGDADR